MIDATTYKGIDYVRVGELPEAQREAIQQWLNPGVMIKIMTPSGIMRDCVQYRDYQDWFYNSYAQPTGSTKSDEGTSVVKKVIPRLVS
ncbi:hypothetical protein [Fulvivirga ligni]|uniref:hypothetical protein n=1 Tax=Fulvivirga ligni TaxID=2904246 RepID=UPI001F3FD2CC|nr:hypothetical protein [Fulvivirga ligni]UII22177.1 hypothetical protein LVD16_02890 [Fulvivirga ligni]